jgi:GAG-pre-integrase domain
VFTIPNTLLVETPLPFCILSPQHLAQEHRRSKLDTIKSGTCAIVGEDEVELQWANRWYKKTIEISKPNNIPIMQSASGFSRYKAFAANVKTKDREITCFDAHMIPDDESVGPHANNNNHEPTASVFQPAPTGETVAPSTPVVASPGTSNEPHVIETFERLEEGLPQQEYEQLESRLDNPTHELHRWHYKLGHESFRHLQWMAKARILPKHLSNCRVPKCSACYYGKASWRPWREKGVENKNKPPHQVR